MKPFLYVLVTSFLFFAVRQAQAEELYPELDCPSRTPIVIVGTIIGAALVYEIVTPNVSQPNGITFFTSVAVGSLAGGFAGAVYAQKKCQGQMGNHVSFGPGSVSLCYDF